MTAGPAVEVDLTAALDEVIRERSIVPLYQPIVDMSDQSLAPDDYPVLEPWAETWQHWVSATFLHAYRSTIAATVTAAGVSDDHSIVPREERDFDGMLCAFTLEKALYELAYELNNRPEWVRIPLAGILRLASRLQS